MKSIVVRITLYTALSAFLISCGGGSGSTPAAVVPPDVQSPIDTGPSQPPIDTSPPQDDIPAPTLAPGTSNFGFTISDAVRTKNTERWNAYIELQIDAALAPLNDIEGLLSAGVPVTYDECGFINAFYDPFARAITLCDELVDTLLTFWSGDAGRTVQSLNFILYHEIGHALADVLRLPITGNEESAADSFATVISGETDRALGSIIGGLFLAADQSSFGDEHFNGEDRSGDISCWAIGSDATLLNDPRLTGIIQPFIDAGRDCSAEYDRQNRSVLTTVPALETIQVSPITDPNIIALSDPNPPKTNAPAQAPSAAVTLTSLQTPGNAEFWICAASTKTVLVAYAFINQVDGSFQQIQEGATVLPYTAQETANNEVTLTYTTIVFVETLSNVQFTGTDNFTASSDAEGELVCVRTAP